MTDHHTDDVLKDLEMALAVTPSPQFADGVHARLRGESARRRMWPVWAIGGLAAAVAAMFALVFLTHQQSRPALQPLAGEAPQVAEAARATSSPFIVPTEQTVPRETPQRQQRRGASSPAPAEPVLEVLTNQGEMLRRMWARVAPSGALKEVDTSGAEPPLAGNTPIVSDAVTAPVAIAPVVVKPLGEGGDRPDQPTIRNREINAGRAR
jgi:hypothetical protein